MNRKFMIKQIYDEFFTIVGLGNNLEINARKREV
jgi:hypothetical protein